MVTTGYTNVYRGNLGIWRPVPVFMRRGQGSPDHLARAPRARSALVACALLLVGLVAGSGVFRGYSLITVSRGAATTGQLEVFGLDAPLCEKTCGGAAVAAQIERSSPSDGGESGRSCVRAVALKA